MASSQTRKESLTGKFKEMKSLDGIRGLSTHQIKGTEEKERRRESSEREEKKRNGKERNERKGVESGVRKWNKKKRNE